MSGSEVIREPAVGEAVVATLESTTDVVPPKVTSVDVVLPPVSRPIVVPAAGTIPVVAPPPAPVDVSFFAPSAVDVTTGPGGVMGPQGPPGEQGPPGVPGTGGDLYYVHTQAMPMALWNVVHNLGKKPSTTIQDAAGTQMWGSVRHVDDNQLVVKFEFAITGTVHCS
jgi:hypothetical protein